MHTKIKWKLQDSRNTSKIKLFPQRTENNNVFEVKELVQLPNGSFVPKQMKLTYGKDINPHYEHANKSSTWENILT